MMAIIVGNRAAEISAVTEAISSLEVEDAEVTDDVMRACCQADRWVPPGSVCGGKKGMPRGGGCLCGA